MAFSKDLTGAGLKGDTLIVSGSSRPNIDVSIQVLLLHDGALIQAPVQDLPAEAWHADFDVTGFGLEPESMVFVIAVATFGDLVGKDPVVWDNWLQINPK